MKTLLSILLIAGSCLGSQQSLLLDGSGGSITVPNTAPFNAVGSMRLEVRIHDFNPVNQYAAIPIVLLATAGGGQIGFQFTSGRLCTTDWTDDKTGGGHFCTPGAMSLAGMDLVVRFQRDTSANLITADFFDYRTGAPIGTQWLPTGNPAVSMPMSSPAGTVSFAYTGIFDSPGAICKIAWIKWFSTIVPAGPPYSQQATPADLADWQFEGNLTNQAAGGVKLTTPSASFAATPAYLPSCNPGVSQSFRAGFPAQLDGSASAAGDDSVLSYNWQQIPSVLSDIRMQHLRWSSHTIAKPVVSGLIAGPLNFRLTVTQGDGQTSSCTVHDGAVATDSNGTVLIDTGNPTFNDVLTTLFNGPQVQLGKNPWPYYDQAAMWDAAVQMSTWDIGPTPLGSPSYYQPWWDIPAQGTVAVTAGGTTVIGTGTNFLSTVCNSDGTPNPAGSELVVWYLTGRTINGVPETGRRSLWANHCSSDTQLAFTIPENWRAGAPAGSGFQYAVNTGLTGNQWANNGAPANFYDNVQAYYELYFRSGIDTYLVAARNAADRFWRCPQIDMGAAFPGGTTFPAQSGRANSISGLVLRALDDGDGHPDMWAGLHMVWQSSIWYMGIAYPGWSVNGQLDPREYGYTLAQIAYCALWDPDPTPDAPGNITYQAYCRAAIKNAFQTGAGGVFPKNLDPVQQGWLSWYQRKSTFDGLPGISSGQPWTGSTVTLTNGSTAVACTGNNCNWQAGDFAQHNIAGGGATCTSGPNCFYVPILFTDSATFPADSSHTDAVAYCQNGCTFIDSNHFTLDRPYQGTSGTHGWVMSVIARPGGYDLGFVMVGYGQDSFVEGILGWAFGLTGRAMSCTAPATPTNCDDGTSAQAYSYLQKVANWLITYAYMPAFYGTAYFAGFPACEVPVSTTNPWCNNGTTGFNIGAREIMGDALRGLLAAYQQAPTPAFGTIIDNWYAGMWSKPGTNTVIASPDGAYDNSFDATGCTINPTYPVISNCGAQGYYLTNGPPYSQKVFGQYFGISNLASWPVIRNGGLLPSQNVQIYVGGRIGDVPGAAKVQVLITEPTGISDPPVVCDSSPCAVTVNKRAGNPLVQVNYLSAAGAVLHSGEPVIVNVN